MQAGHGQFERSATEIRFSADRPSGLIYGLLILSLFSISHGCSKLRLPAIDPNGSHLFLPCPNTTQLVVPEHLHSSDHHCSLPTPAFQAPATPPPCVDASQAEPGGVCNLFKHKLVSESHEHFRSPGKAGEIELTPVRVVAPVGGEVVLLAGICGDDGYLVKRQPLEWMLSPDSVGQFIEVGNDAPGKLAGLMSLGDPKIEKLDVDFARGRTSNKEQLITRGTPACNDDIKLREGETWLSVSSPSEGVSRVTVLAPDSEIWDRRRQTATIYWVDAEWQFPSPKPARAGETIQLVTRVTRSEKLVPATDWIVRYTILDPSVATFAPPTGSNVSLVKVNSDGQAIAQLTSQPGARGSTPVMIDVIKPADPSDNLPEIVLGRGQTIVTFSSPALALQTFGPEVGSVGELLTYVASLANPGDIDAENVRLEVAIPVGTRLVSATPEPSSRTDTGLIWDQGLLAAQRQLDVSIVVEALQANTFDVAFRAQGAGLSDQKSVRTQVIEASVGLRFAPLDGISQAEVGNVVRYGIDVTNTGRQTLTNLKLLIESDPGLPEAERGVNRVEQTIPVLQPGATASKGVSFAVRQEGQQTAKLTVSSANSVLAQQTTSILGIAPRPKRPEIGVDISFAESLTLGEQQTAQITLKNSGEVNLTGLKVELLFDREVEATGVDQPNFESFKLAADRRSAIWSAQNMMPRLAGDAGDVFRQLLVSFRAIAPTAAANIRVRATAAEGVQAEDVATFRIVGNSVVPPAAVNPPTSPPQRTGRLEITLSDFRDPTIVGQELRYGLRVNNNSNVPDRNVRVELKIPQGVQLLRITAADGSPVAVTRGADGSVILPTIQYMRPQPGSSLDYIIVVVPNIPQQMEVLARTFSENEPTPIMTSQVTTVTARNP